MEREGGMAAGANGGRPGAALPTADDLWGAGWDLDEGDGPGLPVDDPTIAAPLTALPDGFPDEHVVADADRTWTRSHPPALVHTVALAFDDTLAARTAATLLEAPAFAARLAEDVAVDAPVASGGMLLPPVVRRLPDLDVGQGAAVGAHRAAFSFADDRGTLPIVLDVAVLRSAATVVLVTAVTPGDRDDDEGWRRLVAAVARRAHGQGSEREPHPG
jgi:hypothetical protein